MTDTEVHQVPDFTPLVFLLTLLLPFFFHPLPYLSFSSHLTNHNSTRIKTIVIMSSEHQPLPEPWASNGISSTTNGDMSAHLTHQTPRQHQSEPQPGTLNQSQSISAGVSQYPCSVSLDPDPLILPFSDEIALYDRQIRLWGVKAQERYGKPVL